MEGGAGAALARTALSSRLSFHVLTPVDGLVRGFQSSQGPRFFLSETGRGSFRPTRHDKKKTLLHFRRLSREENADINKPGRSAPLSVPGSRAPLLTSSPVTAASKQFREVLAVMR